MRYAAFVRAVMVGREGLHRAVLIDAFVASGATAVASHLATGNVTFDASPERLDHVVEDAAERISAVVDRATELFVRSADELAALLAGDPFAAEPYDAPRDRLVTFFHRPPDGLDLPIVSPRDDLAVFARLGREVLTVTRAVDGRQPGAPGGMLERLTGQPATTRAISTLERIARALTDRPPT